MILGAALYDEQLGDHHRFGFPSDTALVVARGSLFLTATAVPCPADPLSLELRAGLGRAPRYRSAVAAQLWVAPTTLLSAQRFEVVAACGARLEAHLALRPSPRPVTEGHDPALVVRAQVTRTALTFTRAPAATVALISAGVDLR